MPLVGVPTPLRARRQPKVEIWALIAGRPNIGFFRNPFAGAVSGSFCTKHLIGCGVHCASTQARSLSLTLKSGGARRQWWSRRLFGRQKPVAHRRRPDIDQGLPVFRKKRIEHHKGSNRLLHLLGSPGNHHAAVGVADQDDVLQFLPLHLVDDVGNMGVQIDAGVSRCERSHSPVSVGVNTSCPLRPSIRATRCQHQAPCQAP